MEHPGGQAAGRWAQGSGIWRLGIGWSEGLGVACIEGVSRGPVRGPEGWAQNSEQEL